MAPTSRTGQRLYLDTGITYLKGVGPARAEAFRRLGVITAGDLLYHIPHRYEDASTVAPIASLEPFWHVSGRVKNLLRSLLNTGF